ncbi:UbiD family decarboxylase [Candidatus Bathyarchaeota archaeon]|nr:UbiD family decarboxylase [Candidatus Bathyarchaeota archaeon]MBS7628552.1 UbiD family decarboxylase [Candidatus Bathyarchaeota archaeon]
MPHKAKTVRRHPQRTYPYRFGKASRPPSKRREGERQVEAPKIEWEAIGREPSEFKRKLLAVGYLTDRLARQGVETYLVGGGAVEVYTSGQFITGDIDLVVSDREKAVKLLKSLGFRQVSRTWINLDLNMAIDIVGSNLSGSKEKIRTVELAGLTINLEGVEDLIVKRLYSYKFWRQKIDLDQAVVLLKNYEDIDTEYLRRKAAEQQVIDTLEQISRLN